MHMLSLLVDTIAKHVNLGKITIGSTRTVPKKSVHYSLDEINKNANVPGESPVQLVKCGSVIQTFLFLGNATEQSFIL